MENTDIGAFGRADSRPYKARRRDAREARARNAAGARARVPAARLSCQLSRAPEMVCAFPA